MKKNLIYLIVSICLFLQSNTVYCAQKGQTWTEWWKSWYSPSVKSEKTKAVKGKIQEPTFAQKAIEVGQLGSIAGMAVGAASMMLADKHRGGVEQTIAGLAVGLSSVLLFYLLELVEIGQGRGMKSSQKHDRIDAQKLKEILRSIIASDTLYPTRSAKLNVLIKKDEFKDYIDIQDDFFENACSELIKEIDVPDYPRAQQIEDEKINKYISSLNVTIAHLPLEQKIAELEKLVGQQKTIEEMRGYLSLYYRLKNKLVVEKNLTTEERATRVVLPAMIAEQQKKFETYKKLTPEQQVEFEAQEAEKRKKEMYQRKVERLLKEKEVQFVVPK